MRQIEVTLTDVFREDVGKSATAGVAAVGCLDGALLKLIKDGTDITDDTTPVEVTAAEADFVGYAAGELAFTGPFVNSEDGSVEMMGDTDVFNPTNAVTPNTIGALVIENAGETKIYGYANIEGAGIPMTSALCAMDVKLLYRPDGTSYLLITV